MSPCKGDGKANSGVCDDCGTPRAYHIQPETARKAMAELVKRLQPLCVCECGWIFNSNMPRLDIVCPCCDEHTCPAHPRES